MTSYVYNISRAGGKQSIIDAARKWMASIDPSAKECRYVSRDGFACVQWNDVEQSCYEAFMEMKGNLIALRSGKVNGGLGI